MVKFRPNTRHCCACEYHTFNDFDAFMHSFQNLLLNKKVFLHRLELRPIVRVSTTLCCLACTQYATAPPDIVASENFMVQQVLLNYADWLRERHVASPSLDDLLITFLMIFKLLQGGPRLAAWGKTLPFKLVCILCRILIQLHVFLTVCLPCCWFSRCAHSCRINLCVGSAIAVVWGICFAFYEFLSS